MSPAVIDADLGALHERILREASEEFWRYVATSARIGGGTTLEAAARISGLSKSQLRRLASLHWLLSGELASFLSEVPAVLGRLSRTSRSIVGVGREVRGAIDWGETVAVRATQGGSDPTFAFTEAQAENDTPPNRVVKAVLSWVVSAAASVANLPLGFSDEESISESWVREAGRRSVLAQRTLRHPALSSVRAPTRLAEHDLRACAAEAVAGYRRAVSAARLRRALVEREDEGRIAEMLRQRVLVPARAFRLFEIWIVSRVAAHLRARGLDEVSASLLGDAQGGPVYRFQTAHGLIEVFFQGQPVSMSRASVYRGVFDGYDLDVATRIPDIVIQCGAGDTDPRLLIEAKASSDARYIADGAYKLIGYVADFSAVLPSGPVGLLVTTTRPSLVPGADRRSHRIWISTVESLDSTLTGFLEPVTR